MEKVHVLVGWSLPPALMEGIASLDPRIHLLNDPYLAFPRPQVGPPFPFPDQLLSLVPDAHVHFTSRLPPDLPARAPYLQWIHLLSAGADVALRAGLERGPFTFTTSSGIHAIPISEWVLGAMIALVKQLPQVLNMQRRGEYWKFIPPELAGSTAGILGLGKIGSRVAQLCKALEMRVLGMRRSLTEAAETLGPADLLLSPRELPRLLRESDFLIICLPGTQETQGLLGERELQQMSEAPT